MAEDVLLVVGVKIENRRDICDQEKAAPTNRAEL
jgi:hypothetical protein